MSTTLQIDIIIINDYCAERIISGPEYELDQVQAFIFDYSGVAGSKMQLSGGFGGCGQPKDVNKFLTYATPSASQTTLPSGTQTFMLAIIHSAEVIPSTFSAVINNTDITNLFHPAQGTAEVVKVPVAFGRNVLQLSVDGNLPTRVATDSDRLVLQVP